MKKTKWSTLLLVSSILMMLFGIIDFVVSIIGIKMGTALITAAAAEGSAATVIFGALVLVLSMITCVVMLIAGVLGAIGKKLNFCQRLSYILIILAAVSIFSGMESGSFVWYNIFALVLPVLYGFAVWKAKKQKKA